MNEEKKQRVLSAVVSGGVMLLCMLVAITVYQIVGIIKRNNKINFLNSEIVRLENQLSTTNKEIDDWSKDWKIEIAARELGYEYPDKNW